MPPCSNSTKPAAATAAAAVAGDDVVGVDDHDDANNNNNKVSNGSNGTTQGESQSQQQQEQVRPYPWNAFSDTTYLIAGSLILGVIVVPTMMVIALSNIIGYGLQIYLYERCAAGRAVLEYLRSKQRRLCQIVGNVVLLDPRDSSYLGWMAYMNVLQPLLFCWVVHRYLSSGNKFELWVFLVYHLVRVGPRHQGFAHHATLVHKEGHATRVGLFCNPFVLALQGKRVPLPKMFRRLLGDHFVAGISGLLYGTIPNHYATAHNKIHHRWHNDTGDVHTNMDLDRTSIKSYLIYLPRFVGYWTGVTPLLLFVSRREYVLARDLFCGMVYYYVVSGLVVYKMGWQFYWAYTLYPLLEGASFLGVIAYLWHSFSEPSDPTNQYVNSITILRGGNNVWNEDYHVVHHHEPNVHWTNMPDSFESHLDAYVSCRATVFADCEQGMLIAWMFGYDWDTLTNHFVDLQYVFADGSLNKNPSKRLTVKQVADYERQHAEQVQQQQGRGEGDEKKTSSDCDCFKSTEEIRQHHEEIKAVLLKRLRYHYMGTRQTETSGASGAQQMSYNDRLSANVRDWDEGKKDS